MFPLKDSLPTERPPIVTLALIAAGIVAALAGPWEHAGVVAVTLVFLWWFGPTVEDTLGRTRFVLLLGAGAALAAALTPAAAPAGAVSAAIGAHAVLYPGARAITAVLLPLFASLVELPMLALLVAWIGLQAAFGMPAAIIALVPGLLAARLLGRPKPLHPPPYRVA